MSELHRNNFSVFTGPPNLVDMDMSSCASTSTVSTLKRPASSSFEGDEEPMRKRLKEDSDHGILIAVKEDHPQAERFADELSQELQCGCCSELVYRPVLVMPCQHFFCGSCCVLWIRNGGTNCPACRSTSIAATPFRAIQSVVDTLLRLAPEKARAERERQQADEVYKAGTTLRIPSPKEPSPEPNLAQNPDLAYPCPHCSAGNSYGWRCPQPIPDPTAGDPDHGWHLDEGNPPGHGVCANCDNLLALEAPITTKCDFCQLLFCGINVPGRCSSVPLPLQHPHGFGSVPDLIESSEIYDSFEGNTYEVEIVFDYLRNNGITPRHIYRSIVSHVQQQPRHFIPLVESDIFSEIHGGGSVPQGPFNRICRACAADVLLWGLKDWWIRERKRGLLDAAILRRPDCPDGSTCLRQKDAAHARECNHVVGTSEPSASAPEPSVSEPAPLAASSSANVVENLISPFQNQAAGTPPHRSVSSLSFLLNAPDSEDTPLPTIAQVMQTSSTPDMRGSIDAFSP